MQAGAQHMPAPHLGCYDHRHAQVDQVRPGSQIVHQHAPDLPRPWQLLQKVLRERAQELRQAAELQAASRRPVIWRRHLDISASCTSTFRLAPQITSGDMSDGDKVLQAVAEGASMRYDLLEKKLSAAS